MTAGVAASPATSSSASRCKERLFRVAVRGGSGSNLSSGMSGLFLSVVFLFLVSLFTESSLLLLVVFYLFFNYLSVYTFSRRIRVRVYTFGRGKLA